ncbi:1-phosphofructokinase, partial [Xanthomonas oryzae pv. oryzae]
MVAGLAAALLDDATTLEQCARLATAFSMCRLESGDARRMTPEGVRRAAIDVAIEALS